MNSDLLFLSNFLKKPKEVAAIAPSSKYVVSRVMEHIDFNKANCIVEYGPGTGVITKAVLESLNSYARIICLESNQGFCEFLNKNINDPRLEVINDTAERLDYHMKRLNISNIDYILSGIPFSLIKKENKKAIITKTEEALRKHGRFIVYQQYNLHLSKYLEGMFGHVKKKLEVRNIPPTAIFVCEKS